MEQAYFSQIRSKIIPYLNQAKEEVVIAMAWFTSAELFDALLSCLERRVNVELILLDNAINYMYFAPDFNELINAGGHLRIADSSVGFMHHKFCVIDDKIAIAGGSSAISLKRICSITSLFFSNSSPVAVAIE